MIQIVRHYQWSPGNLHTLWVRPMKGSAYLCGWKSLEHLWNDILCDLQSRSRVAMAAGSAHGTMDGANYCGKASFLEETFYLPLFVDKLLLLAN